MDPLSATPDTHEAIELIALDLLHESPTNPRKSFDPVKLEELTESIRSNGVQVPLLVRRWPTKYFINGRDESSSGRWVCHPRKDSPGHNVIRACCGGTSEENQAEAEQVIEELRKTEGFEVVAGARRYRASITAGKATAPCVIRALTDAQVLELQVFENLHRSDVHPIEEAESYRALIAHHADAGWHKGGEPAPAEIARTLTPADVALLVSKPVAYVARRLKLLNLELPAKMLFVANHLTIDHAEMLARLTPEDQTLAVRNLIGANHQPKKMDLVAHVQSRIAEHARGDKFTRERRLIDDTPARLKSWIDKHVMLKLKGVPWDLADANLVPAAGACTDCPKRSGANTALWADLTTDDDTCMDPTCFASKHKALVKITIAKAAEEGDTMLKLSMRKSNAPLPDELKPSLVIKRDQWVRAGSTKCDDVKKGIVVDSSGQMYESPQVKAGVIFNVCANQKCAKHKHTVVKPSADGGNRGAHYDQAAEDKKGRDYVTRETPIRAAVVAAIVKAAKPKPIDFLREQAKRDTGRHHVTLCAQLGITLPSGATPAAAAKAVEKEIAGADMERLAVIIFHEGLVDELYPSSWQHERVALDRRELWAVAKAHKVNADAIAKEVTDKAKKAAATAATEAKATLTRLGKAAVVKAGTAPVFAGNKPAKKAKAGGTPGTGRSRLKKLSAEGRKRIADAMKKRWAERRKAAVKP